jgi:CubicO group peptidase (beta-lactamase class C family)
MKHAGAVALAALAPACVPGIARAAPDEMALGKAEGYPVCPPTARIETRCLVGLVSRRDEAWPSRRVPRGRDTFALARAPAEPRFRYRWRGSDHGVDDYLATHRTTGLLVLKGDTILAERYQYDRNASHRMTSMSMAKTVVAMLVGIAIDEGAIKSVDDTADRYVPQLTGTEYGVTPLRHLLSMSSGVAFSETYRGSDDIEALARLSMGFASPGGAATVAPFNRRERAAGARFHYASAETQVLGLVLRAATGKPVSDYLSEKIWQPMGAEADASWLIDKGGFEAAFTGLNATLRDYGRLGLLLANDGATAGRQVIPAAWVRAATTPPAPQFEPGSIPGMFGYGYQTWILGGKRRQFVLRGVRGQAVFVDPEARVVLVHTCAAEIGTPVSELVALWSHVAEQSR